MKERIWQYFLKNLLNIQFMWLNLKNYKNNQTNIYPFSIDTSKHKRRKSEQKFALISFINEEHPLIIWLMITFKRLLMMLFVVIIDQEKEKEKRKRLFVFKKKKEIKRIFDKRLKYKKNKNSLQELYKLIMYRKASWKGFIIYERLWYYN